MKTKNPNNAGRLAVLRAYRSNPSGTLKELVQAAGYSKTTVYYHLSNLQNEGVITRERKPRRVYVQTAKAVKPSVMIDPTKSAAGRRGKGGDAFSPRKPKNSDVLEENLKKAVALGKENDRIGKLANNNVVMHSPIRLSGARKVG